MPVIQLLGRRELEGLWFKASLDNKLERPLSTNKKLA
jgi:hypothetical protein